MLPVPVGPTVDEELESEYSPDELEATVPLEPPELSGPTVEL